MSASSQSLRFILSLSLYSSFITSRPDLFSWADKIVEPRPDMNIKIAAYTANSLINMI